MRETTLQFIDAILADLIRQRTASGAYYQDLAQEFGVSYQWILTFGRRHGIRSRKSFHTPEIQASAIAAVELEGLRIRAAAKNTGMSRSAVHRLVQRRRQELVDAIDSVGFRDVAAYRCKQHGKVTIAPCPACEAEKAKAGA